MKTKTHALPRKATLRAAAASAVFALPAQTDAAIVYSGIQNITATIGSGFGSAGQNLTIGGFHFGILVNLLPVGLGSAGRAVMSGVTSGAGMMGKLAAGANISAGGSFSGPGRTLRYFRYVPNEVPILRGIWPSNQTGFAGVQFGNTLYGWIRLKWTDSADANPYPNTIIALDWAYNDTPNGPIFAGQVPEPGQALLALASLGATALRRRRKAA